MTACLICGKEFKRVGKHVKACAGISYIEYCERFNLPKPYRPPKAEQNTIECRACGKRMLHVSHKHVLKCSGITMAEYRQRWPDAPLVQFSEYKRLPGPPRLTATAYRLEDRGHSTPCWIWELFLNASGYGSLVIRGKSYRAHRYMYELHKGPIPEGLTLDHLCRQPSCVNPEHLEPVTMRENTFRASKLRQHVGEIKELYATGEWTQQQLADRFGSSSSAVGAVITGVSFVGDQPSY